MKRILVPIIFAVFLSSLAGCSPEEEVPRTPQSIIPKATSTARPPTPHIPEVTITVEPTLEQAEMLPVVYADRVNGFQMNYPDGWSLIPYQQIGSRGGQAQLFSAGSTAEIRLAGGTRISILLFDWDPRNDLSAYVAQRKIAWDSGGQKILLEKKGSLADGWGEVHFIVESPDKEQTFSLFTIVGNKYLQVTGDGDLEIIERIARTIQPLN